MQDAHPTRETIAWSVMRDHGFTNAVREVFKAISPNLSFEQFTQVNVHRLAEDLGFWPKTVASALRQLERKGIIQRGVAGGVSVRFRLNPTYGWIGAPSPSRTDSEAAGRRRAAV